MACVNRNTKEYQEILDRVGDPFLADAEYIYQYRRVDVFRNDVENVKLERVDGTLGNAIYLTDNITHAKKHGAIHTQYYIDQDDVINVGNEIGFKRAVNSHLGLDMNKAVHTPEEIQKYLEGMFADNKVILVNKFNQKKPSTDYLVGNINQIYKSPIQKNDNQHFQKLTQEEKAKTIDQITKEHRSITALKDLAAKLAHRIGGKVEFVNDTSLDYKGYNQGNTSVINLAYATSETNLHEILAHPIIRAIKNKEKFNLQNTDLKIINGKFFINKKEVTKEEYFDFYKKGEQALREDNFKHSELYQSLLKELETGRGKEVFEQVKRDYITKEKPKSKNYNLIDSKNNSEIEIIQNFGDYWFKEYNETLTRGKQFNTNEELESLIKKEQNKHILSEYTLEEQQEEAIVQIIGLYSAEKLDKLKDKTLIQLIKELLKEMSDFVKLIFKKEINITKDLDNISQLTDKELNKLLKDGEVTKKCE